MRYRTVVMAVLIAAASILAAGSARARPALEPPPFGSPDAVPPRTALSVRTPLGTGWGTANEHETRSALSLAKLYLADYALRYGNGSATDLAYLERMIRYSDDAAADAISAEYPFAIDMIAAEYGLAQTHSGVGWNACVTSTADLADFLDAKQANDPGSPILGWMATASPIAADGTHQNWGTSHVPGVVGTKWGWSDLPPQEVASVSFGPGFTVAAQTLGGPDDQTADVLAALVQMTVHTLLPTR